LKVKAEVSVGEVVGRLVALDEEPDVVVAPGPPDEQAPATNATHAAAHRARTDLERLIPWIYDTEATEAAPASGPRMIVIDWIFQAGRRT
jgi:hypothetical protein